MNVGKAVLETLQRGNVGEIEVLLKKIKEELDVHEMRPARRAIYLASAWNCCVVLGLGEEANAFHDAWVALTGKLKSDAETLFGSMESLQSNQHRATEEKF